MLTEQKNQYSLCKFADGIVMIFIFDFSFFGAVEEGGIFSCFLAPISRQISNFQHFFKPASPKNDQKRKTRITISSNQC
jgi:hypothetical protein